MQKIFYLFGYAPLILIIVFVLLYLCIEIKERKIKKEKLLKEKRVQNNKQFDVEQYARMCNASLEHKDEMDQYKKWIDSNND